MILFDYEGIPDDDFPIEIISDEELNRMKKYGYRDDSVCESDEEWIDFNSKVYYDSFY